VVAVWLQSVVMCFSWLQVYMYTHASSDYTCMCTRIQNIYPNDNKCVCTYNEHCGCTYIYKYIFMFSCVCVCRYVHIYFHRVIYIYIYIYIYPCIQRGGPRSSMTHTYIWYTYVFILCVFGI